MTDAPAMHTKPNLLQHLRTKGRYGVLLGYGKQNQNHRTESIGSVLDIKYGHTVSWFRSVGDMNVKVQDLLLLIYDSMLMVYQKGKGKKWYEKLKRYVSIIIPSFETMLA